MPSEETHDVLTPQKVKIVWRQWVGVLLLTAYLCWPFLVAVGEMFPRGELTLDLRELSKRLLTVAFVDASDPWQFKLNVKSAKYALLWLVLFPLAWLPIKLNFLGRFSGIRRVAGLGWTCAAVCGATAFTAAYCFGRQLQHLPPL